MTKDATEDGWQLWRDWHKAVAPENEVEIRALDADRGEYLGYIRLVGRRRADVHLEEPLVSIPAYYTQTPLLRTDRA